MITLCSLWDSKYHGRGLALIESLRRHVRDFHLCVLALDSFVYADLQDEPNITVVSLKTIEDDELLEARSNRTWVEYIWTLSSVWAFWCMDVLEPQALAYIDADCYLFNDLRPLYDEIDGANVAIIPHRWTPAHANRLKAAGTYNVSWVYFTRKSYQCLSTWRNQCIEWCYHETMPDGRFADQGYLNGWPKRYNAHVVQHLGAGLAPWNQEQYAYDGLTVSDGKRRDPILFYHFHGFEGDTWSSYKLNPGVHPLYEEYEATWQKSFTANIYT